MSCRKADRIALCRFCGDLFTFRYARHSTYCSRECAFIGRKLRFAVSIVYPRDCAVCLATFIARQKSVYVCSDSCRIEHVRMRERARAASNKVLRPRDCKDCGRSFTPEYGDKRSVYCSHRCRVRVARRISRSTRRARVRRTTVRRIDPFAIFERDGWICRACSTPTPRELRGTRERNAPELDHWIPLSLGGTHTEENVQLLCRQCNQEKGSSNPATHNDNRINGIGAGQSLQMTGRRPRGGQHFARAG